MFHLKPFWKQLTQHVIVLRLLLLQLSAIDIFKRGLSLQVSSTIVRAVDCWRCVVRSTTHLIMDCDQRLIHRNSSIVHVIAVVDICYQIVVEVHRIARINALIIAGI